MAPIMTVNTSKQTKVFLSITAIVNKFFTVARSPFRPGASAPSPDKSAAMKMASTPTENKPFTARHGAAPIFMLGGAPRAHEVLSECGLLPHDSALGHFPIILPEA